MTSKGEYVMISKRYNWITIIIKKTSSNKIENIMFEGKVLTNCMGYLYSIMKKGMGQCIYRTKQMTESYFPGGSYGKEPVCNAGDSGSIYGLVKFPGVGNGYPLQYFGLENPMDRKAW